MVVQINTSFEVPVPRDRAWEVLLDVEGIAPCMPGATLDGRDGDRYLGRVKLRIGPITAQYSGAVTITETDPEAGRLKLMAKGKEQRGTGHAEATVLARLTEISADATRVDVETTLNITGRAAQFGRSVMQDVAKKLVTTFADNLAAQLRTPVPATAGDHAPAVEEEQAGEQAPAAKGKHDDPASQLPSAPPVPQHPAAAGDINVLALLASSLRVRIGVGVLIALLVLAAVLIWL
jgi:carbon monoxide dehydrogenase subunit G